MSLQVIGSGFGRTGTASLKIALEKLGFGPCHHMTEIFGHPEQVATWQAYVAGQPVDWGKFFEDYRSQVDWPGALAWRELAAAYPDAKVIHSVRPEDSWWASFSATIAQLISTYRDNDTLPPHSIAMMGAMETAFANQIFRGPCTDRDVALAAYRKHTEAVRAAIPPGRLLVYDVAEGWEPLCAFLGVAVPEEPFPRTNSTEEFLQRVGGHRS